MLQAECKVDVDTIISDIDPRVFGNFIEFTHDCINQGMWAELLLNRGFEESNERQDIAEHWYATGYNDTGLYTIEQETPFGHGNCQKVHNIHHFGGYKGLAQRGLLLHEESGYKLSIWAKTDRDCRIKVRLWDGVGIIYWQTELMITTKWERYVLEDIKSELSEDIIFEILLESEGSVWLDQCSLMPLNTIDGIWRNVFEAAKASHPTVLRFPGGCFADCYYWEEGIGPRDYRPARPNRHWGGIEENNFGTDEFLKLCENLGCEPMICINYGSADAEEAARWVEYCNGDSAAPMGRLRAQNGHKEPYNVRLWGIGNETWAKWEIGNMTAEQYAVKYSEFSKAMRAASPEPIELIACGGDGNSESQEWNRQVLQEIGQDTEYIDLHFYAPQLYETPADLKRIYEATVYSAHKYEMILRAAADVISEARVKSRIMIGEYNAMYYNNSNREHTLEAALLNAGFLNVFLRNAKMMRIGIFSDLVNGWQGGCIRSRQGKLYRTPSYYALQLYAGMGLSHSLDAELICDSIHIEGAGHVFEMKELPIIDGAAAITRDGKVCLFLINRHYEESVSLHVTAGNLSISEIQVIEGEQAYSINSYQNEPVCIREKAPESQNTLKLSPHSICMAILK